MVEINLQNQLYNKLVAHIFSYLFSRAESIFEVKWVSAFMGIAGLVLVNNFLNWHNFTINTFNLVISWISPKKHCITLFA